MIPVPARQLASGSPYFLLFTHLILNPTGITSVFAANETCEFVFDEQMGHDLDILLWWPQFKHIAAVNCADRASKSSRIFLVAHSFKITSQAGIVERILIALVGDVTMVLS